MSSRPTALVSSVPHDEAHPTTTITMESAMKELIEAIRAAVADGATTEQKALGAQACRTIMAALDAAPGKPIVLPGAPQAHPLASLSVSQALDLAIERLTSIAAARESQERQAAPPAPRGMRIPMATSVPTGAVRANRRKL